jgi:hypothetical protein
MKKAIFLIPIIFIISSCGYSSYEQCTLKEIQKCETGACNGAAYSYCKAKFPEKYKWVESNDKVYVDLKKNKLSFERKYIEEKYKLCLTHNDDKECHELIVLSKYERNTDYADFVLSDLYPNVLNAKSSSEITYTLQEEISYR